MFLLKPNALKHEIWVEIEPYLLYVVVCFLLFYIVHQCISYFLYKYAAQKGALKAIKEYEEGKKR